MPSGAIWANQFDNVANRQAHIDTTGPEIWRQTDEKIDGFICACGSGGTLAGVAAFLQPKGVNIGLADPMGAALTLSITMVFFLLLAIQLQKALDKEELQKI